MRGRRKFGTTCQKKKKKVLKKLQASQNIFHCCQIYVSPSASCFYLPLVKCSPGSINQYVKCWAVRMLPIRVLHTWSDAALALAQPCTSPVSPAEPASPPTPRCWMQPGSEPTGSWGSLVIQRIKMMKWHEMKAWLNAYQNPQAGLIGRVIYLVLVSAFSFHAKSSSVVVSVGHG